MKTILATLVGVLICITPLLSQNETEIRNDGLLIPRIDRNTVNNPTAGHLVYDFVSDQFWFYNGTEWKSVNTDSQTLKDILDISEDAGNNRITNLLDPVNAQDAATKSYVDLNDDNTDNQDLFITGNTLELSGDPNAGVDLSGYMDNTDEQDLSLTGNTLMITGDPNSDVDLSGYLDNTDSQDLILTGNLLEITGDPNAGVDLSPFLDNTDSQNLSSVLSQGNDANDNRITDLADPVSPQDAATKSYVDNNDDVDDADSSPTNELQTISKSGSTVILSNGGGSFTDEVNDADNDPTNELDNTDEQDLSLSGNILSISNDPNTDVDLSGYLDNTDDQNISGSSLTNNMLTIGIENGSSQTIDLSSLDDDTDADSDPTNEIQTLAGILSTSNDAGNNKITNVMDPMNDQDVATKSYIDSLLLPLQLIHGLKVEDIDGNIYDIVEIGTQIWLKQNLRVTRYNDGTQLPEITNNIDWMNLTTPAYSWYNNDSTSYSVPYGALYNYYAVADTNSLNVCPVGWHVPSETEMSTLSSYLGGGNVSGGKLKSTGTLQAGTGLWEAPNTGATNESCFTGLPGGGRCLNNGSFHHIGEKGRYYVSTDNSGAGITYELDYSNDDYGAYPPSGFCGYSVRCIKD